MAIDKAQQIFLSLNQILINKMPIEVQSLNNLKLAPRIVHPLLNSLLVLGAPVAQSLFDYL